MTITAPSIGPCADWITAVDVSGCGCCERFEDLNPDLLAVNLTVASEILYMKSGQQFPGECEATVWPCCQADLCSGGQWGSFAGYPYLPDIVQGRWYNISPGRPCVPWECGRNVPTVDLGRYPVTEISEVKIDGVALDPSSYRLDSWRFLVRIDGELWPVTQNLTAASDAETDTWTVSFVYGQPPPQSGVSAAAQLACELTKHCQNDQKCALPLRVTAISRQGVTYSLADVMDVLDRGKTGLYFVDLFLDTYNPDGLVRPARVLSPDVMQPPRRLGST